uniref:Uncharacterized protein n=1 Tax=Sphaerodactylus townsendi TaxID=933632 RepID=A0ACB8F5C7_9SAUR
MEIKMDQMLAAMGDMKRKTVMKLNVLENKWSAFELNFKKIEDDLKTMKEDLTRLKVVEPKIETLEERMNLQDNLIGRFRRVPEEKDERVDKLIIQNLAKFLDLDEDILEEDTSRIIINSRSMSN